MIGLILCAWYGFDVETCLTKTLVLYEMCTRKVIVKQVRSEKTLTCVPTAGGMNATNTSI